MSGLIGIVLLVGLIAVAAFVVMTYMRRRGETLDAAKMVGKLIPANQAPAFDPAVRQIDPLAKFRAIGPGQALITHTDDYHLVRGAVTLKELTIFGDSNIWTPTGREFVIAQTDDEYGMRRAFAWLPSSEGGELKLYRMSQELADGWTQFLAGTDNRPGPARNFADLDQRFDLDDDELASIQFERLDTVWQMTDIGQARYTGAGNAFLMGQGELRFAMAKEVEGRRRLLFVDFLEGGSGSSDGLFVGDEFDPQLIKDIQPFVRKQ